MSFFTTSVIGNEIVSLVFLEAKIQKFSHNIHFYKILGILKA